jgi:branched-chain amino acid transport system permease protein
VNVPPQPALSVSDLAKSYAGVRAVDGVNFRVRPGEAVGLIGPNGAGKSTVVGMISGAIRPSSGRIYVDGARIDDKRSFQVARLGLIRTFQLSSEFSRLTVLENLLVAAHVVEAGSLGRALFGRRAWRRQECQDVERARALLERVGLADLESAYASELSGGQRRLLEIMRALMCQPKILVLDEPMAGVNRGMALKVERYLQELRDEGLTMILVEHELGVVERLCGRVVAMAQGRVLVEGPMSEVRANHELVEAYLVG